MASIVNNELMQFRVSYKFPRQKAVNMNYTAPSVAMLMRNLQISEGVNRDTVEFLYVHHILTNGQVKELVSLDKLANKDVTDIQVVSKTSVITGEYDDEEDDDILGWGTNSGRDEHILKEVTQLLTKDNPQGKPKVKLKSVSPKRQLIKGFNFSAKPAVTTKPETK